MNVAVKSLKAKNDKNEIEEMIQGMDHEMMMQMMMNQGRRGIDPRYEN